MQKQRPDSTPVCILVCSVAQDKSFSGPEPHLDTMWVAGVT